MAIFIKNLSKGISKFIQQEAPVLRFNNSWESLGAQVRPKVERSPEQLRATLDYLSEKNQAVKEFLSDLKKMNPKGMALACDTIELANRHDFLMTNVDMNKISKQTGKSLLQHLLSILPKAAKENPESIEFAQEVINNTDTLTAKYFLADLNGIFSIPEASEHLKAIKPLIKDFAEATINGGYLGTFEKQSNFTHLIRGILTPDAKPEKILLIKKLTKAVDLVPTQKDIPITLNKFVMSETPIKQVEENIEILPQVLENTLKQNKGIDVVDFVNNNVNLFRG